MWMKTCPYCGHEMNEKDNLCIKCGNQVNDVGTTDNYFSTPEQSMPNQPVDQMYQNQAIDQMYQSQPVDPSQQLPTLQPVPPYIQPITTPDQFFNIPTEAPVQEPKKLSEEQKRKILKYGGIALGVVVLILVIILIFNLVASKNTGSKTPTEDVKLTEHDESDEDKEYLDNSFEYNSGDITYNIPNEYKATTLSNGSIDLNNSTLEKEILLSITNANYKDVNSNQDAIKKNYENKGLTINKISNQLINNQDYIVLEAKNRDMQILIALTSKEEGIIHVITVYNKSNEYDYELLNEAANIIKYAKYKEKTA